MHNIIQENKSNTNITDSSNSVVYTICTSAQYIKQIGVLKPQPIMQSIDNHIIATIKSFAKTNNVFTHNYLEWVNISINHSF